MLKELNLNKKRRRSMVRNTNHNREGRKRRKNFSSKFILLFQVEELIQTPTPPAAPVLSSDEKSPLVVQTSVDASVSTDSPQRAGGGKVRFKVEISRKESEESEHEDPTSEHSGKSFSSQNTQEKQPQDNQNVKKLLDIKP